MTLVLKQATTEECWATTFNDITEPERADKVLSDIARHLTSARHRESRISDFLSHLAKIFGGGLRTNW